MEDFIVANPYNGFHYVPDIFEGDSELIFNLNGLEMKFKTIPVHLSLMQAMKIFWRGAISKVAIKLNAQMLPDDEESDALVVNQIFQGTSYKYNLYQSGFNPSMYDRLAIFPPIDFIEVIGDNMKFNVSMPKYVSDFEYVMFFYGYMNFNIHGQGFLATIGLEPFIIGNVMNERSCECSLFDMSLPCHLYHNGNTFRNFSMSFQPDIAWTYNSF